MPVQAPALLGKFDGVKRDSLIQALRGPFELVYTITRITLVGLNDADTDGKLCKACGLHRAIIFGASQRTYREISIVVRECN